MTPDANDLCVFAVKRGDIEKRIDINYNLPKYTLLEHKLRERFGEKLKPLGEIADVICGPFGSAIKNTDYQETGIPLIRITNISKEGYMNYEDMIYISEELGNSLKRTQVTSGDIVLSQRGSLGQCAVVDDTFEKMNISANIIAIKNIKESSATFIHDYLLSNLGQTLLERNVSGQVQQKITTQDIADILIPIGCNEDNLSKMITTAYCYYKNKIKQSEGLLSGMSKYLFDVLQMKKINYEERLCCAIKLTNIVEDQTFSAEYYHPERMAALHLLKSNANISALRLSDVVAFHRDIVSSENSTNYLGLAGVESQTGELSGVQEEAAGQAFIYKKGDILYGRLRPYLNKVIVAENNGICSTEFHVMRVIDTTTILPEYVAAILRSDLTLSQTKHMMTGNTHPRISNDDVRNLYIPVPGIAVQERIVDELKKHRMDARRLRIEAEQEWQEARKQFEKELLGEQI